MYNKIERLCRSRGISVYRLAKDTGISTASMSQWKRGISKPGFGSLRKIAQYFGVTLDYFYEDTGELPVPTTSHTRWIPVMGRIAAGVPAEMVEDIVDYEEIESAVGDAFALVINGDSMAPQLLKGDIVIVRRQEDVESGEVAIVAVNGYDGTCKRIIKTSEGVILQPLNPNYQPIFYSNEEILALPVKILGRVMEIRRKL